MAIKSENMGCTIHVLNTREGGQETKTNICRKPRREETTYKGQEWTEEALDMLSGFKGQKMMQWNSYSCENGNEPSRSLKER
jgi:hypothetical protein